MPSPPQSPWFYLPNNIWWWAKTLSVAQTIKRQMNRWLTITNWIRCERKRSWPDLRYCCGICLQGLRKSTVPPIGVNCLRTNIRAPEHEADAVSDKERALETSCTYPVELHALCGFVTDVTRQCMTWMAQFCNEMKALLSPSAYSKVLLYPDSWESNP
jgi:hypothetical protein